MKDLVYHGITEDCVWHCVATDELKRQDAVATQNTPNLVRAQFVTVGWFRVNINLVDRIAELRDIFKTAIHGGKTDIGNLVQALQLTHDQFANLPRDDLALAR